MTIALPSGAQVELYPDEPSWLAGRSLVEHQVGGSDVACLMDRSPDSWGRGPWTMWARSQGLETHGFTAAEREDLDRGHRWELHVIREYAAARGYELALEGRRAIVRHPEHPWATVSPDDFSMTDDANCYVEAKTARHGAHEFADDGTLVATWDADSARAIPVHYALQCLWGLHLTGLPAADLVVCIPRSGDWPEIRTIRLLAQPALQADLFAAVAERREQWMVRGVRPAVDGSDDCAYALRQLFPAPAVKVWRNADRAAWGLVERKAELASKRKAIEAEERLLNNQLVELVGPDSGLRLGDDKGPRVLIVRQDGRQTVDLAGVRKHPAMLAQLQSLGLIRTSEPFSQVRLYGFGNTEE